MKSVVIGLDVGTSALKAAALGVRRGECAGSVEIAIPVVVGEGGRREQSVGALVRAVREAIGRLVAGLPRGTRVEGIGVSAQGGSGAVVERSTGKPRTPMYLWNDLRFMPHLAAVARLKSAAWWRGLSRREGPGWGLGRLAWLQATRPECLQGDVLYAGAGELVFHSLTGRWAQDACNALQQGVYRVARRRCDETVLGLLGLPGELVAPLREGDGVCPLDRPVAGVPRGVPVAGPYMDHEAAFRACGQTGRVLQVSLGTAWVANFAVAANARYASPFQLVIPSPVRAEDDLVIQPLLTGNVTWDWVWRELLRAKSASAAARSLWAEGVLPAAGLTALPWLNMPHPWLPGVHGGGIVSGVSPTTTREDLARAMASGMAHELRRVLAEVLPGCEAAVLTGGAARAAGWQQLAALALGVPTRGAESPMEASLVGSRGAVAAIAPAAGVFRAGAPIRTTARDRRAFDEQHAEYCASFERLAGNVPAGGRFRFVEDK